MGEFPFGLGFKGNSRKSAAETTEIVSIASNKATTRIKRDFFFNVNSLTHIDVFSFLSVNLLGNLAIT